MAKWLHSELFRKSIIDTQDRLGYLVMPPVEKESICNRTRGLLALNGFTIEEKIAMVLYDLCY